MAAEKIAPSLNFKDANKGLNVSLFSAVRGQLSKQGKPLEGVKVERSYHFTWANKDYKDKTYTDEQGRFYFSEAVKFMLFGRLLPHETVIPQTITAFPEDTPQPIDVWLNSKRNYRTMGELSGLDEYMIRTNAEHVTPVMNAYTQGEIALQCDLSNITQDNGDEADVQYVTPYTAVKSPCNLQLPYQTAVNQAKEIIQQQQPKILHALALYLANSPTAFNPLQEDRFKNFQDLSFESIDLINLYDHLELQNHLQDYGSNHVSVALSGEIILNMKNPQEETVKIRMWLNHGFFRVTPKSITFLSDDHALNFNEFNIDANNAP
ncbi:transthyretin-like family protein [Alkalimarinus alittae]|uniref:Transthyretin-like family protein n=1 Tax=Alkalimarinus alittae TaxID=2961619 RepID=A0ABY6N5T0_9ALTE|nr:transthyretin-like family protein [Alkalimarinus alittae]UZE97475.1 transthyretin-like family protein [Alkalimarinus alittae]